MEATEFDRGSQGDRDVLGSDPSQLESIIGLLELKTRDNQTLETVRRELIAVLKQPEDLVDQAVAMVRRKMDQIRNRDIPRTMTAEGRESWYLGPDLEQDIHWPALLTLLEDANWDSESLRELDEASTKVVSMLEHPGVGEFHTKGVVLGYVQSGKTTNFTSVIAKAADAGYRLFIVLSGIHDGLRQQTQARLEEQLVEQTPEGWIALTERTKDFRPNVNVNAFLTGEKKVLCVVKKNGTRLRHLSDWLDGARGNVLQNCPTILVDDEADQASINTARDQNRPSSINGRIREIIDRLPKAAYIGYTATPFANVLINPSDAGDLYPRDFIVDLPRPRAYVGSETIFGREPLQHDDDDDGASEGLDMIRIVPDDELDELRPSRRDISSFDPDLTESLRRAIGYFLMSTAARRNRGLGNRHATMLVHTTMRVAVHGQFRGLIEAELGRISHDLERGNEDLLRALRTSWNSEIDRVPADDLPKVTFEDLSKSLADVVAQTTVIEDNSRSDARLHYGGDPVTAIAVGGNTLSRGLTLEGLCVSFFVRTTNAYDTLLQMGRWFGYRHGYQDLPRIWMPLEMAEWFRHLAGVEREIRNDIERFELEHKTPRDFGVRIATHPQLAITAASKMRASIQASVSYSGRRLQTIRFRHRDALWLAENQDAAVDLIEGALAEIGVSERWLSDKGGVALLRDVPAKHVIRFLRAYRFSERSYDLNSERIAGYIMKQNEVGELGRFTVAVMGRGSGPGPEASIPLGLKKDVPLIVRSRLKISATDEADIKALMSKQDRAIDLEVTEPELADMPNGQLAKLRNSPEHGGSGDGSGLLLLYPIARSSAPRSEQSKAVREPLDAVEDVIGVGLVFPEAQTTEGRQTYVTADLGNEVLEEPIPEDELDEEGEGDELHPEQVAGA